MGMVISRVLPQIFRESKTKRDGHEPGHAASTYFGGQVIFDQKPSKLELIFSDLSARRWSPVKNADYAAMA
jgi:hypothetical protein